MSKGQICVEIEYYEVVQDLDKGEFKVSILIIKCSLNPKSRSDVMAHKVKDQLEALGVPHNSLDLKDISLPFCDGSACYNDPEVKRLTEIVNGASVVLMAVPIYNYDVNAAAKNVIELLGQKLTDKAFGFICAAGGSGSYMSVMSLANSLMLDFRCVIIPRFVYASFPDFEELESGEVKIKNEKITERLLELATEAKRYASFVAQRHI